MKAVLIGIVSTVVGGLLLALVVNALGVGEDPSPVNPPSPSQPDQEPITFYIMGRLGAQGVMSAEATVSIDGKEAGVLTVDQSSPSDQISHTVSHPGTYEYEITAVSETQDAYGQLQKNYGSGHGTIKVKQGSTFEVRGSAISGNTYQVHLVDH
jgi:hypothetical protein